VRWSKEERGETPVFGDLNLLMRREQPVRSGAATFGMVRADDPANYKKEFIAGKYRLNGGCSAHQSP